MHIWQLTSKEPRMNSLNFIFFTKISIHIYKYLHPRFVWINQHFCELLSFENTGSKKRHFLLFYTKSRYDSKLKTGQSSVKVYEFTLFWTVSKKMTYLIGKCLHMTAIYLAARVLWESQMTLFFEMCIMKTDSSYCKLNQWYETLRHSPIIIIIIAKWNKIPVSGKYRFNVFQGIFRT